MKLVKHMRTEKVAVAVSQAKVGQWGAIYRIADRKILHIGKLRYIRRVFNKRYASSVTS